MKHLLNKIRPEEAPELKLRFCARDTNNKNVKFNYSCTPDTGAPLSIMSKDLANKYNVKTFECDNDLRILAANGTDIYCSGVAKIAVENRLTKCRTIIEFLITPDIEYEVLIAYRDLTELQVIPAGFPNTICKIIHKLFLKNSTRL